MGYFPYQNPTTLEQNAANWRELDRILSMLFPKHETKMFKFAWVDQGAGQVLKLYTKNKNENDGGWDEWP